MMRNLLLIATIILSSPAAAQIDAGALEGEVEAVSETMDSGFITLERDLVARNTCSVDLSTGDLLIDDRLCKFAIDCANNNPGNVVAAEDCVDERRARLSVILARRNISVRARNAEYQ